MFLFLLVYRLKMKFVWKLVNLFTNERESCVVCLTGIQGLKMEARYLDRL